MLSSNINEAKEALEQILNDGSLVKYAFQKDISINGQNIDFASSVGRLCLIIDKGEADEQKISAINEGGFVVFKIGEEEIIQHRESAKNVIQNKLQQIKELTEKIKEDLATPGRKNEGAAKILMATVKGDVHDIGKNIVGVVLGCNGYEVIDLGVMVPTDKLLDTAIKENVSMIGVSGLITPSLDEMVGVAKEMKRRNMNLPLLIGGATTSRIHTAVKIAPNYDYGVVHVLDASRSVTVVSNLLNPEQKPGFLAGIKEEYEKIKTNFENKKPVKQFIPYADAKANALKVNWENYQPVRPTFIGTKNFIDHSLSEIREYIDWKPFFISWELHGNFPDILTDKVVGIEATKLYKDANEMLDTIIKEKWLTANGMVAFMNARKTAPDTVEVEMNGKKETLEFLRQQVKKAASQPNLSLSDFIMPAEYGDDFMGAFAVTIKGIEPHLQRFIADHDDYNKIMLQAMSDRLVESFAEMLHKKTRMQYWGYVKDENLSKDDLIHEKYIGVRPAPGYPACPEHTEKFKLFDLLKVTESIGIELTEALAMYPASSVCGWYFSHPQSQYFGIGRILQDQYDNYKARKHWDEAYAEKWLRPVME
jgi:5-methyltetrahydrofolate--homocysteine methyltransferase